MPNLAFIKTRPLLVDLQNSYIYFTLSYGNQILIIGGEVFENFLSVSNRLRHMFLSRRHAFIEYRESRLAEWEIHEVYENFISRRREGFISNIEGESLLEHCGVSDYLGNRLPHEELVVEDG